MVRSSTVKNIPEQICNTYKTAIEIDQRWIIEMAADRQQFIDQGQSVNMFFSPDVSIGYLARLPLHGLEARFEEPLLQPL